MPDTAKLVERACEVIRADAASDTADIIPSFFPDFGTVSTAAMYGGKLIPAADGGSIHIEPVARSLDEFLTLQPCRFEESDYQRAIDLYRQVCARLGTDEVCTRTPDFQGPLNTLALLMDQTELMIDMMERPEAVETALDRITDTLIACTERYRQILGPEKVIGNIWPYVALPDGVGVGITQDFMPLVSAHDYARFELPLLKRIADRFGGVYIHCCGKWAHHLPALAASGIKIWGVEVHEPETRVEDVYAVFGDRVAITPYVAPTGQHEFPTLASLVRSWKGRPHTRGRYWFCFCPEWGDVDELRDAINDALG